ncbi:MAG: hypothetical protein KKE50_04675 [Nanoarchaeota archaeon]|nr:hypothetical protein [Nanoarchaeota archaeon]
MNENINNTKIEKEQDENQEKFQDKDILQSFTENKSEKELIENINEFYNSAVKAEQENKYNVAVTLFFKASAVLADLYILKKEGKIPNSHSERFRILELRYSDIYKLLDKNFPFYQDSYRIKLNKEICEVLKNDAEQLIKLLEI